MIKGATDEENIKAIRDFWQCGEVEARFLESLEKGEITGDVREVDDPKQALAELNRRSL